MKRLLCILLPLLLVTVSCGEKDEPSSPNPAPLPNDGKPVDLVRIPSITDLQPITVEYPAGGVVLGSGYDTVSGRFIAGRCVTGRAEHIKSKELSSHFTDLQDRQQLFDSLKVSVNGSVGFGGGGASVSSNFAKTTKIDRTKRNTLATVTSISGGEHLIPPEGMMGLMMHPNSLKKAEKTDLGEFRQECGDGFVSAIRYGGRLSIIFSYALDSTELSQSLTVSAEGSYGAAKGKASMERIKTDSNVKMSTETTLLGEGGNSKTIPTKIDAVLEAIENAGSYRPEDSGALEVVVTPYSALADAPSAVRGRVMPGEAAKGLIAQYRRLYDLFSLYYNASLQPEQYYFPYWSEEESEVAASIIKHTALCVANLVNECATNPRADAQCSISNLLEITGDQPYCQAMRKKPQDMTVYDSMAVSMLGGIKGGALLKSRLDANAVGKKASDILIAIPQVNRLYLRSDLMNARAPSLTSDTEEEEEFLPYDVYFSFLAAAPLKKVIVANSGNESIGSGDEISLFFSFCAATKQPCKDAKREDLVNFKVGENPSESIIKVRAGLNEYIKRVKLGAISATMCSTSLTHPLCRTPSELSKFIQKEAEFGKDRGFTALASVPPDKQPRKRYREPYPDICNGRCFMQRH